MHQLILRDRGTSAGVFGTGFGERVDHLGGLFHTESQVGVRMQAEDFRVVHWGNIIDVLSVLSDFIVGVRRDLVFEAFLGGGAAAFRNDFDEGVFVAKDAFLDVVIAIGIEELTVETVSDSATILDLASHVLDDVGVDGQGLHVGGRTAHQVGDVLLDIEEGSFQVGVVEFVRDTPAQRTEFTAFLHHRVHETGGEGKGAPGRVFDLIEEVLTDHRGEGLVKTRLQAFRRLVGHLQGGLQESQGEFLVRLRGDPETELIVDLVVTRFHNGE